MRVRHSLGLLPENLPGLRPLRNHQFVFALQRRDPNRRAQRSLRDTYRNRAIKIRAASLEKRMFLHLEKNIKIACRSAIRSGFALACHAQTRARIHSGGNSDVQSPFALDAPLTTTSHASVANHLPRALARRASTRNREKSLLVSQLPVSLASAARCHSTARFRSGALAILACFVARDSSLGVCSGGCLFKRQRHVVPQVSATLASLTASTPPSSAQYFLESEKAAENILKFFENAGVKSGIESPTSQSRRAVAVVHRAFLRIGKNRVRFARRAKTFFRLRLFLRIAIRMILQSGFPICRFNLFGRSFTRHAQNFIEIFWI